MTNISNAKVLRVSTIHVPEKYRRRGGVVEDDKLRQSIERTGIQQPLVVSKVSDGQFVLIDGYRRLEVAKYLKMSEVPCVIDEIPDGVPAEEYRDRIRFILDEHRQDLFPSQRAMLIKRLKRDFEMNSKQVGEYLGVDSTTIANWLVVDSYIPEVTKAIDSGEITQHAARVFEGMTEIGQTAIWKGHKEELRSTPPPQLHRALRDKYHPDQHPDFYTKPERTAKRLNRVKQKRITKRRPVITKMEKDILFTDIEVREAELRDAEKDLEQYKLQITLASRVIRAILQNEKLYRLLPEEVKPEFRRFAEIYI